MGELFVFSAFVSILLLVFPVFLYLDSYVDVGENRAWFAVSLYRVKLAGGYGELDREGILFHITEKKAVFVPYKELADTRKKFEVTKGFQLYTFRQTVETGGADKPYALFLAAAVLAACGAVGSVLQSAHPFLSLKNSTLLGKDPCLKLTTRSVFVFNGIVLAVAFTKKVLEAILKWIRKKSATSLKRQKSS